MIQQYKTCINVLHTHRNTQTCITIVPVLTQLIQDGILIQARVLVHEYSNSARNTRSCTTYFDYLRQCIDTCMESLLVLVCIDMY